MKINFNFFKWNYVIFIELISAIDYFIIDY